ncbi:MAG: hypothetical protein JOY80_08740 [Candidatus Dormibacteraeota bacterium]|nr:hypothetical protein [Candidatus Dormibacteraeota bacterium]
MHAVRPDTPLRRLADRSVFAVDGVEYEWADVVADMVLDGRWQSLQTRAEQSLDARRHLRTRGAEVSRDDFIAAAHEFRYTRDLLAAEELLAWLEHWCVSEAEWRDHLLREVVISHAITAATVATLPDAEVTHASSVDAFCSGALQAAAYTLAGRAAIAAAHRRTQLSHATDRSAIESAAKILGGDPGSIRARLERLTALEAAYVEARTELLAGDAVGNVIQERRLEWLRYELDFLELPHEHAAREAHACLTDDGLQMDQVAARANRSRQQRSLRIEDAEPWLAPSLVGVREGSVLGPLASDGGCVVGRVTARIVPQAHDDASRQRAEAALLQRAAEHQIAARVRWHEHL